MPTRSADAPVGAMPGLDPGEHLLLTPTGDGPALLGRAVSEGAGGVLVIADERAPGCHVDVREVQSAWHREYQEDLGKVAVASASLPSIGGLRAQYGSQIRAQASIANVKELVADVSGPCGDVVVKRVKIGTGSRELQYRKDADVQMDVTVAGVGTQGGTGNWERIGSRLAWDQEQAWAFAVSKVESGDALQLRVDMPTEMVDGTEYSVRITSTRQVWLVVLNAEADGRAGILLPNSTSQAVSVGPDAGMSLPLMRVSLRNPITAAREKIVLVAFTERADYDDFRPPAGAVSDEDAAAYLRGLDARLAALPRKRWSRTEVSYLIQPKGVKP